MSGTVRHGGCAPSTLSRGGFTRREAAPQSYSTVATGSAGSSSLIFREEEKSRSAVRPVLAVSFQQLDLSMMSVLPIATRP